MSTEPTDQTTTPSSEKTFHVELSELEMEALVGVAIAYVKRATREKIDIPFHRSVPLLNALQKMKAATGSNEAAIISTPCA